MLYHTEYKYDITYLLQNPLHKLIGYAHDNCNTKRAVRQTGCDIVRRSSAKSEFNCRANRRR